MSDLIEKTKAYAAAVNTKNHEACLGLFADNATMSDPLVAALGPKTAIAGFYKAQFEMELAHFAFKPSRIMQSGNTTIMEFVMEINDASMNGVDVIDWEDGKIVKLSAYVNGTIPAA